MNRRGFFGSMAAFFASILGIKPAAKLPEMLFGSIPDIYVPKLECDTINPVYGIARGNIDASRIAWLDGDKK